LRYQIVLLRGLEFERVHEIGVQAGRPNLYVLQQRMGLQHVEGVPAHVRNLQIRIGGLDAVDFAGDPAEAGCHLIFAPAFSHQLHADTDAEKRFPALPYTLSKGVDHSRNFVESAAAISECANAGQDDAVGTRHCIWIARHSNWLFVSAFTCGPFKCLGRRMQIAGAIVDDGNAHRCAPGSGNKPMTSDGDGGPRRIGVEYLGSGEAGGLGGAPAARLPHSPKKRRSAISASSPITKPSMVQPRRARVQRHMLGASKPISNAISSQTRNCVVAGARSTASPTPTNAYPTT